VSEQGSEAAGWVPSNTHPANTTIVASGVDTLHLGYRGELRPEVEADLERRREDLMLSESSGDGEALREAAEGEYELGGSTFALSAQAGRGRRYRLFNADLTFLIARNAPATTPTVMAQLRSGFLWRVGWCEAERAVSALVSLLLMPDPQSPPPMLSRLDLCADFQGWQPTEGDRRRMITARIYDKTAELVVSGKEWIREVWQQGGWNSSLPVWRLEFQLRREALREFKVADARDMPEGIGALWRSLGRHWLRLAAPVSGQRRERWPIDPAWESLLCPAFGSVGGEAVRSRKRASNGRRIESGLLGYVSSFAAHQNCRTLGEAMALARDNLERNIRERDTPFEDLVARKARRMSEITLPKIVPSAWDWRPGA
jgi:hypothetical protein